MQEMRKLIHKFDIILYTSKLQPDIYKRVSHNFKLRLITFCTKHYNISKMDTQTHPTFANGKICYLELPSRDINESSNFYNRVFGWKIRTRSDGAVAFDDGVGEVSGTWRTDRKPSSELGLLVHIMVDDIEASIKAVTTNGGKIVQPVGMEAPEITARFSDPTGNVLGLFQQ